MRKSYILVPLLVGILMVSVFSAPTVKAATIEELQAQIQQLLQILARLQVQILQMKLSQETPVTPVVRPVTGQCGWCGVSCQRIQRGMYCPQIAPPAGYTCKDINGVCTKVSETFSELPDLTISSLSASKVPSNSGTPTYKITATEKNISRFYAGPHYFQIREENRDTGPIAIQKINSLAPNQTITIKGEYKCYWPGIHTITARANFQWDAGIISYTGIKESNLLNNTKTISVYCPPDPSTCTDSDGGKNYYVKGTVKHHIAYSMYNDTDRCINHTTLEEYYCDKDGQAKAEIYSCPSDYTCQDGACVKEEIPVTSQIRVLSPNGGEKWVKGNNYLIKLEVQSPSSSAYDIVCVSIGKTTIDLYKGGELYKEITQNFSLKDNYFWKIPADIPTGNDYKIKISTIVPPCGIIFDTSDNYFSITEAGVCTNLQTQSTCLNNPNCYWDQQYGNCQNYDSTKQVCYDPDGGRNIYVRGHTFGFRKVYADAKDKRIRTGGMDACYANGTKLREYYCADNQYIEFYDTNCPSGYTCKDGACVKSTIQLDAKPTGTLMVRKTGAFSATVNIDSKDNEGVSEISLWDSSKGRWITTPCPVGSDGLPTTCGRKWTFIFDKPGNYTYCGRVKDTAGQVSQTNPYCNTVTISSPMPVVPTCTDNDGGDNLYVKGIVISNHYPTFNSEELSHGIGTGSTKSFTDYCENSNTIKEFYCVKLGVSNPVKSGIEAVAVPHNCPTGYTCQDGACKSATQQCTINNFVANPSTVRWGFPSSGNYSVLSWNTSNCNSCHVSSGSVGYWPENNSNSVKIYNIKNTTTFTLECLGLNSKDTKQVIVTVIPIFHIDVITKLTASIADLNLAQ